MNPPNWSRLFPDQDFRWSMALQAGDARDFFSPSEQAAEQTAQRRAALAASPEHYAVLPESAARPIGEALALLETWTGRSYAGPLEAGAALEPDWVLLEPDETGVFRVAAGIVCFPSLWSLPEKAGLPIQAVHGPVPGLNEALARPVDTFLARLAVGDEWERENWGLSADDALDHHPRLPRPPLTPDARLETTWLRTERQLFARLPGGGLLFGIRIRTHRLDAIAAAHPDLAPRIARALETLPEPAAAYKSLTDARRPLAAQLRGVRQPEG